MENEINVTSLEDLNSYANGQVVKFPDFAEGQPFVAVVRRPSLLSLMKEGKIPNRLLSTANSLFARGGVDDTKEESMKDLFSLLEVVCKACLVSPSYDEVINSGLTLTDEQMMFIFNYTQKGVKAVEPFRS